MDVKFPFKVELVEMKGVPGWSVKILINTGSIEEAHQIGETLSQFLTEMNEMNEETK